MLLGQIQSEKLEGKKNMMETGHLVQLKLFQLLGRRSKAKGMERRA